MVPGSFILFTAFLGLALRPLLVRKNRRMGGEVGGDEAAVRLALSGALGLWWAPSGTRQWPVVGVPRGRPGWLLFSLDVWGAWAYADVSDGLA
mgnify:CR=1 FL=1